MFVRDEATFRRALKGKSLEVKVASEFPKLQASPQVCGLPDQFQTASGPRMCDM